MVFLTGLAALMVQSPSYLVVDRLIIGSYANKTWTKIETVDPKKESIKFTRIGLGSKLGTWTANGVMKGGPTDAGYVDGDETTTPYGVMFSGTVSFPRKVQMLSNSNSTYQNVLKTFLKKYGIASKARLTKVVRVDLDGNGTQEVILEASNRDEVGTGGMTGAKPGDYSLVLLRYESKGKVVEYPLSFDHPKAEDLSYSNRLAGIADFDGDGVMEIVLTSNYYEGQSAAMFRYQKTTVKKLVEMGDGA